MKCGATDLRPKLGKGRIVGGPHRERTGTLKDCLCLPSRFPPPRHASTSSTSIVSHDSHDSHDDTTIRFELKEAHHELRLRHLQFCHCFHQIEEMYHSTAHVTVSLQSHSCNHKLAELAGLNREWRLVTAAPRNLAIPTTMTQHSQRIPTLLPMQLCTTGCDGVAAADACLACRLWVPEIRHHARLLDLIDRVVKSSSRQQVV